MDRDWTENAPKKDRKRFDGAKRGVYTQGAGVLRFAPFIASLFIAKRCINALFCKKTCTFEKLSLSLQRFNSV